MLDELSTDDGIKISVSGGNLVRKGTNSFLVSHSVHGQRTLGNAINSGNQKLRVKTLQLAPSPPRPAANIQNTAGSRGKMLGELAVALKCERIRFGASLFAIGLQKKLVVKWHWGRRKKAEYFTESRRSNLSIITTALSKAPDTAIEFQTGS